MSEPMTKNELAVRPNQKFLFHVSQDPKFVEYDSVRAQTVKIAMNSVAKKILLRYSDEIAIVTLFARHVDERSFSTASQHFTVVRGVFKCQVYSQAISMEMLTVDDAESIEIAPPRKATRKERLGK